MGNTPPGRDSGSGAGGSRNSVGSPLLDPLPVGELPTPFSRFNEISKAAARQWRTQFQQRLADGAMKDFWSPPPGLDVPADNLEDFVPLDTGYRLPHGHFGIFPLVKYRKDGRFYRMKVHSKKMMRESSMPKCSAKVLMELQVLANAENPFILKLRGYFMDYMNIYLVLEDYRAGDLNSALIRSSSVFPGLREAKILSETEARFLAAQLISALHYMHSINVMHRDIKTHNVLLKFTGYLVLCDFGFSKLMKQEHRTYSVLGTWEFMAPEILRNQGYTYCADFWGYGCILHQLVAGCPPYKRMPKAGNGLHFEYKNLMPPVPFIRRTSMTVRKDQYTWEDFDRQLFERQSRVSALLSDLLSHLLRLDPYQRLGSAVMVERNPDRMGSGAMEIMSHVWFRDIDFIKLQEQSIPAPWKPRYFEYNNTVESDWIRFDVVEHIDPNNTERQPQIRSVQLTEQGLEKMAVKF